MKPVGLRRGVCWSGNQLRTLSYDANWYLDEGYGGTQARLLEDGIRRCGTD